MVRERRSQCSTMDKALPTCLFYLKGPSQPLLTPLGCSQVESIHPPLPTTILRSVASSTQRCVSAEKDIWLFSCPEKSHIAHLHTARASFGPL